MPELPEVETVVRLIRPRLTGRRITQVRVLWERTLGGLTEAELERRVRGRRIARVWRRAKQIVLDLEYRGRPAGHLLIHLRMTGRLHVHDPSVEQGPYLRVSLALDRGVLHFIDVRKFGRMLFREDPSDILDALGPEPLDDEFTAEGFHRALRARRRLLKPLLLDQTFLAGLGNIYVDEALHRAGLHPMRRSDRLPKQAAQRLHAEIRATLLEAIEREGSSFDTFYRTPEGQPGSYQDQFRVYGRDGEPCLTCGRTIRKLVVAQRGTHICTRCQPAPRRV